MTRIEIENNDKNGRFVLYDEHEFAGEMTYRWSADKTKFVIDHTGVEKKFGGKGYGKLLVLESVDFARKNNLKITPVCPFAKRVFEKNKDLNDVLT